MGHKQSSEAKASPERAPPVKKPVVFDPSDYQATGTIPICCSFFMFLLVIPILMVFFYHMIPTTTLIVVVAWAFLALLPWMFHAGGTVTSDISGPLLTVTLFVSVILAFLNGTRCYYQHAQPLRQLATSRVYNGVYPELPATALPDAAMISFAGDTHVDATKAVGFNSLSAGLHTFCVAPVVSSASTGIHNFWAIGVDCCGDTGEKFECYDADDPSVKTGWVLPKSMDWDNLYEKFGVLVSLPEYRRDLFVDAAKKAAATYGVVTPGKDILFVRWTKESKEDILKGEAIAVLLSIIFTAIWQIAVSFFMTRMYQRFQNVRKFHRSLQNADDLAAEDDEEDISARLHKFVMDVKKDARGSDFSRFADKAGDLLSRENLSQYRPPLSFMDMCLMGVLLPYIALMLCVVLSTFAPCESFGHLIIAPFWCMTLILILALLATPNRAVTGLFVLLCCTAGYYIGEMNYENNMFHYCTVEDRRVYKNVKAEDPTDIYWDAGKLKFESSAILSTEHSVGYLYNGVTYCAAPVISTAACAPFLSTPAPAPVSDSSSDSTAPDSDSSSESTAPVSDSSSESTAPVSDFFQLNMNQSITSHHGSHKRATTFRKRQLPRMIMEDAADSYRELTPAASFMQRRNVHHQSRKAHTHAGLIHRQHRHMCPEATPSKVEFWAIGTDCCDARKKFWCDGGEYDNAHQAVIVRAFEPNTPDVKEINEDSLEDPPEIKEPSLRQHYFSAINQAIAAYGLPEPERPVLLRWGKSADELQKDWHNRAYGTIFMAGIATLLLILAIGLFSFCFMRHARRVEKREMEEYEKRMGGSGMEPTVYDSPRPSLPPAGSAANL